jgi:molecular chaperone DnaJ
MNAEVQAPPPAPRPKPAATAEAYDVLRDQERRARYDRFGHAGVQQGAGMGGFNSAEDIFVHFSDIFGDLFGFAGGRGGPRPTPGADLRYNLQISFKQAATGAEIPLKLPRRVTCDECGGSGAAAGSKPETCRQCGGSGQMRRSQGFFQIAVSCPVCRGEGKIITTPCPKCRGEGVLPQMRELTVRVPAGVDSGTRLRLRGEGENGMYGGPPGDLYVVITVEEDRTFRRHGQDLIHTCKITFPQAALGLRLEVPSLDGPVTLSIPKGTQSGTVLRLKGKGMPYLGQSRSGDLLVEVIVQTPTRLSARQEELIRELDQLLRGDDGPLDKVKNAAKKIFKK